MAEKQKDETRKPPIMTALAVLGVALAFALGFILGGRLQGDASLEERLAAMEKTLSEKPSGLDPEELKQAVGAANDQATKIIMGEIRSLVEGKVFELADPPVQILDLRQSGRFASKGAQEPLLTVVEFSDFQCPYCSRMANALEELVKKYPDRIRLVYVDRPLTSTYRDGFPFHPYAALAHEAAIEARAQGKFWEMYQYIFDHQQEIFPGRPKDQNDYDEKLAEVRDKLVQAAQKIGLDPEKMKKSLENHAHKKELDQTIALVDGMKIYSTPTVYVQGYFKTGDPNTIANLLNNAVEIK